MTATTPIILRASPQEFIEITGIERFDDGSGFTSRISVSSVGYGGLFTCSGHPFYFHDLDEFIKMLTVAYEKVGGQARLANNYESDFVEVSVMKQGHVAVHGFIVEHTPCRQEFLFSFQSDQTFLPELLRSLKRVAEELGLKV